jgi:alanyl-tRNA synthetase
MGLERTVAVLQGKRHNYATDLMAPLVRAALDVLAPREAGACVLCCRPWGQC